MTLNQYINQRDPQRMPQVDLKPKDYEIGTTTKDIMGNTQTTIFINFPHGSYDTMRNEYKRYNNISTLYTTDEDGNKKQPSVFTITELKNK